MSTVFVLGSTGTVGSFLTQRLVDAGHHVRAATRNPASYGGAGHPVGVDLQDPSTFTGALEGVERLFVVSPPGHADQFGLLKPFLDTAFAMKRLERVVTMTAQGVEVSDQIPFRQLELYVEASGVPFVHLRPSWFAQNFHTFWGHGIRQHKALTLPADDAKVAFIDARDIAGAAFGALTRDDIELHRGYELTGPEALTHAQAAAVITQGVGEEIVYTSISDDAFRAQLAPSGMPDDYIETLVFLFASVRMGAAARVTDGVRSLSGQDARPLSDYVSKYLAEF